MGLPKYDAMTARKMIHAFVPISRFNKGEAGKIIEEVKNDGIRVIVKNNEPECVIITVEEYDKMMELSNRMVTVFQSKEEEEKRKAFIRKIREHVPEPIPPRPGYDRKTVMDRIGAINIDEDSVYELRRLG